MKQHVQDWKPEQSGVQSFFRKKFYILGLLALVFLYVFWYANNIVVSLNPEGDRRGECFTTEVGDTWYITFTHSVEKSPWEEYYRVQGINDLILTHTRFESLGWGYPYSPADGNFRHTEDGKFVVEMKRPYKTVKLRIAEQAMPCIVHQGRVYDLCKLFGHGSLVEIKVERRWQYWVNEDNFL